MTTPAHLRAQAAALLAQATEIETPLTRADLEHMTPEAIVTAKAQGRFDLLLGITRAPEPVVVPTVVAFDSPGTHRPEGTSVIGAYRPPADLDGMTPEAIVQARRLGQLDYLLDTTTPTPKEA